MQYNPEKSVLHEKKFKLKKRQQAISKLMTLLPLLRNAIF